MPSTHSLPYEVGITLLRMRIFLTHHQNNQNILILSPWSSQNIWYEFLPTKRRFARKMIARTNIQSLFWQFSVPKGISYPYLVCPRHLSSDLMGVTFNLIKMSQSLFVKHPHFLHYHLQCVRLSWTCFFVFDPYDLTTHHPPCTNKEASLHNGGEDNVVTHRFWDDKPVKYRTHSCSRYCCSWKVPWNHNVSSKYIQSFLTLLLRR